MGIFLHSELVNLVKKEGAANVSPNTYNILFDGEVMRYKAHVPEVLCSEDSTVEVARKASESIYFHVKAIEDFFGKKADKVVVYFDGIRPTGKGLRVSNLGYNLEDTKNFMKISCANYGYVVYQPENGEAELKMYIERDTDVDLNVLVTSDTDVLSIVYNHENVLETPTHPHTFIKQRNFVTSFTRGHIVKDSCVWARVMTNSRIEMIGLDNLQSIFKLDLEHFHLLVAMLGTDFTTPIFTKSMLTSFLANIDDDSDSLHGGKWYEVINKQTTIREAITAILYTVTRGQNRLKQVVKSQYESVKTYYANFQDFETTLALYIRYIKDLGAMTYQYKYNGGQILSHYLSAMMQLPLDTMVNAKVLKTGMKNLTIDDAIRNVSLKIESYFGIDGLELDESMSKNSEPSVA